MNPDPADRPKVGATAIIFNSENKVLVGIRQGSHGAGTWAMPGGHIEYDETEEHCAERETEEETDLEVTGQKVVQVTRDVFKKEEEKTGVKKDYYTFFVHCTMTNPNAVPLNKEPGKCEGWYWKSWEELKELYAQDMLFLPLKHLVEQSSSVEEWKHNGPLLQGSRY